MLGHLCKIWDQYVNPICWVIDRVISDRKGHIWLSNKSFYFYCIYLEGLAYAQGKHGLYVALMIHV